MFARERRERAAVETGIYRHFIITLKCFSAVTSLAVIHPRCQSQINQPRGILRVQVGESNRAPTYEINESGWRLLCVFL